MFSMFSISLVLTTCSEKKNKNIQIEIKRKVAVLENIGNLAGFSTSCSPRPCVADDPVFPCQRVGAIGFQKKSLKTRLSGPARRKRGREVPCHRIGPLCPLPGHLATCLPACRRFERGGPATGLQMALRTHGIPCYATIQATIGPYMPHYRPPDRPLCHDPGRAAIQAYRYS
jgi:hypothetical protein